MSKSKIKTTNTWSMGHVLEAEMKELSDVTETTAGEYPASGHAYISDEGALCVHWPDQKVMIVITTDGMARVAGGAPHYTGFCREIKLDGDEWPHELRSVMCADYVATLKEFP